MCKLDVLNQLSTFALCEKKIFKSQVTSSKVFWRTAHNNTMETEITTVNDSYITTTTTTATTTTTEVKERMMCQRCQQPRTCCHKMHNVVVETTYHR